VYTKTAMNTRAGKTDEDTELRGGPLRGRGAAVAASIIASRFLNFEELRR
jgi:hypothetical protein